MTTSLFQDEEATMCHISNKVQKWVKPPKFNLYDQGNKRVDKSQTHLNGSSLKVDLRQDTNGYMLHQVMNITELLKGLHFPFTKDDKNYLSGRGNYKIVFGHFST